mgnify:CR=1 FL=1
MNNDLISRSALLETIKKSFLDNPHTSTRMKMAHAEEHNHFRILVNNAPAVDTEPVRQWISVKDRLPDDLEEVLILVKETEFYGQYKEFSKSYFCQYIGCVDDGEWSTKAAGGIEKQ